MRNLKAIIAITLTAAAALSLTGCLGGGKLSPAALAKAAKDTASAGVLMMAIISVIVGLIIFLPKLIDFIGGYL